MSDYKFTEDGLEDYIYWQTQDRKTLKKIRKCPVCGKDYEDPPAISRKDNETEICPDCGTLEALESIGASDRLKAKILESIHETRKGAGI